MNVTVALFLPFSRPFFRGSLVLVLTACPGAAATSSEPGPSDAGRHVDGAPPPVRADGGVDSGEGEAGAPSYAGGPACRSTCSGGRCLITLASEQFNPIGVAVGPTGVYWTNYARGIAGAGSVMMVPPDCGAPRTVAAARNGPASIAVTDGSVYWAETGSIDPGPPYDAHPGGVMSAPASGLADGGSFTVLASSPAGSAVVAVDGANVYWANGTAVLKVPRAGGEVTTLAPADDVSGIAVSGTRVYWASNAYDAVASIPVGGGIPSSFNAGDYPSGIAVDAANAYWVDPLAGGSVMTCPMNDCGALLSAPDSGQVALSPGPVALASGQAYAMAIAVDSMNVYWVNGCSPIGAQCSGGSIVKVSRSGGTPVTLAYAQDAPSSIAVDDTSVYWTNSASFGTVMRLTPK